MTRFVTTKEICNALAISRNTLPPMFGGKRASEYSLPAIAKAIEADPAWLESLLAGDDLAISLHSAANIMRVAEWHLKASPHKYGVWPRATLKCGARYSLRDCIKANKARGTEPLPILRKVAA